VGSLISVFLIISGRDKVVSAINEVEGKSEMQTCRNCIWKTDVFYWGLFLPNSNHSHTADELKHQIRVQDEKEVV
jgi:hypothetical protein